MNRLRQLLRQTYEHPVTRRFALGFTTHFAIVSTCSLLGLDLPFVLTFVSGVGSYAAADYLLSTRDERAARSRQIRGVIVRHWKSLLRLSAFMVIMIFAYGDRQSPTEPFVQQVLQLVEMFGLLAVFCILVVSATGLAADHKLSSVGPMFSSFITALAGYSAALWLIGAHGDAVYSWIVANPQESVIAAVAASVVWSIVKFTHSHSPVHALARKGEGIAAPGVAVFRPKPTERDLRYTAAHEAGHAMLYAALGELPKDIKVSVNQQADEEGVLGYVTAYESHHRLDEKRFAEWYMLVFLAGRAGEEYTFGESTLGAGNDHMRWLGIARAFLANHYRGVFYVAPQDRLEIEQNEGKLESLQTEQREMLKQFFEANRNVYLELTEALLEKRQMGHDDLIPFLSRVSYPENFPLPLGTINQFSAV